ncbi:hypothetical protein ncot_11740 [Nocardioides sp. JQ2195]|uniref:hypothetical protein n=1 Tax=Nocardioides sp. JQ2195 TaxID=2592334 RepID=UPI00143EA680|nr:hypothetical protein [Nocardioides sp. JQ2195]QIX27195.1 hypothetical protein ncot_11740 [Nocardioides sp. JQ2195]
MSLTYQWFADGEPIAGATSPTLELRGARAGAEITVTVTGSQPGYESASQTSVATAAVAPGDLVRGQVAITGEPEVGQTLTADPGEWGPVDPAVELAYQWTANGSPIDGATGPTLDLLPAYAGAVITVTVTGTQPGYAELAETSAPTTPIADAPPSEVTPVTPKISGVAKVGNRLTAQPGNWGDGVELSLQWSVSGAPVPGATSRTFLLTGDHAGKRVTVTVTGTLADGGSGSATSVETKTIAKGKLRSSKPRVTGKPTVGRKVSVAAGTWTAGTKFRYVWKVGQKKIRGATGKRFKVRRAYVGKRIQVVVTGSKKGYVTVKKKSAKTSKVLR